MMVYSEHEEPTMTEEQINAIAAKDRQLRAAAPALLSALKLARQVISEMSPRGNNMAELKYINETIKIAEGK